jgi:FdhD protein
MKVAMRMNEWTSQAASGAATLDVSGVRAGQAFAGTDFVAVEVPVALEFNGISHAVMLATPADLRDFAIGFSLTEGIVDSAAQVYACDVEETVQGTILHLGIAAACFSRLKDRRRSMAGRTGCGLCGTDSLPQAVRPAPSVQQLQKFSSAAVVRGMRSLAQGQHLQALTGSTHAAAWCDAEGQVVLVREDVGRHNALDKLVGAMVLAQMSASAGFVVVTSRASYEMVHKTAMLGAGLLAAVSGVTALAVSIAEQSQISLLGFVRGDNVSVYSHPENVVLDVKHE